MGRLLIFFAVLFALSLIGIAVWVIWNKANISIQIRNSVFEIEKEAHKKAKKDIKEENYGREKERLERTGRLFCNACD